MDQHWRSTCLDTRLRLCCLVFALSKDERSQSIMFGYMSYHVDILHVSRLLFLFSRQNVHSDHVFVVDMPFVSGVMFSKYFPDFIINIPIPNVWWWRVVMLFELSSSLIERSCLRCSYKNQSISTPNIFRSYVVSLYVTRCRYHRCSEARSTAVQCIRPLLCEWGVRSELKNELNHIHTLRGSFSAVSKPILQVNTR